MHKQETPSSDVDLQDAGPSARAPARYRRFLPLAALAVGFLAFMAAGGFEYASLDRLAENRDALRSWTSAHPLVAGLTYFAIYTAATAASLPLGTVLTLAGGFVFGTWIGGGLTVLGATLGATLLFVAARTAFSDYFEARLGGVAGRLRHKFADNAFSYLLALRLAPIFPFVVVNVAPALAGVRLWPFVAATAIGIVPGTFVYASVGAGLDVALATGDEPDLGVIFKPQLLVPLLLLAALAVAPVLWRRWRGR